MSTSTGTSFLQQYVSTTQDLVSSSFTFFTPFTGILISSLLLILLLGAFKGALKGR